MGIETSETVAKAKPRPGGVAFLMKEMEAVQGLTEGFSVSSFAQSFLTLYQPVEKGQSCEALAD